jgi:hypothetical protein
MAKPKTLSTLKDLIGVLNFDLLPLHPHFLCILYYKPNLIQQNGIFEYYYNSDGKIFLPGYKKMWLIQLLQTWYLITWEKCRNPLEYPWKDQFKLLDHFIEESTKEISTKSIAQKIILTEVIWNWLPWLPDFPALKTDQLARWAKRRRSEHLL